MSTPVPTILAEAEDLRIAKLEAALATVTGERDRARVAARAAHRIANALRKQLHQNTLSRGVLKQ